MKGGIMKSKKTVTIIPLLCLIILMATVLLGEKPEDLIPLLIDLEGWVGEEAEVSDVTFQDFRGISVRREYQRDEHALDASIVIGYQAAGMWNPMYYDGFKMESGEAILDVKKIDDFFVFHSYQKPDKAGMCIVLLKETSQQERSGAVFAFSYEGIEDSEGKELLKKFDWAKMMETVKKIKL